MQLRYRIVDVFSDRPLAGNALCVVLDPCPTELMQRLARETNLSETTFPTITGEDAYDIRIFTPYSELPFAGHPTLGTAWTLGAGQWTQTSPGAVVTVDASIAGATMVQPVPTITPTRPVEQIAPGPAWIAEAGGVRHFVLAADDPIDQLDPDLALVKGVTEANGCTTFAVVRRRDDANLHVRVFVPSAGIPEDPGTGSVAGPIGVIARDHWGTASRVTIHQGQEVGRPSTIEVDVGGDAPAVGGRVALCAEGTFSISQ